MENNILEKLEEKLRSILSLSIKIGLSEDFKDFESDFEKDYIHTRFEELMLDVTDSVECAIEDIKLEIETDIELADQAEYENGEHLGEFENEQQDDEPWMA